jgi:type II secretory pathway component PulJ
MIDLDTNSSIKNPAMGQKGFTLVDILVGLAMASVLLAAMVSLFVTMGRSYTAQNVAADVQQVTRTGIELMIEEIRMAGFNPTGNANVGIVDDFDSDSGFHIDHDGEIAPTDDKNFAFTLDADMDGRINHCINTEDPRCSQKDPHVEREMIAYRIKDDALEKYSADEAAWHDLTEDNVSDFSFTYYDKDGAVTDDVDAIRTVEISMTVREPAGRAGFVKRTYKTRVRCRNIGL